jgi:hypothetical protein
LRDYLTVFNSLTRALTILGIDRVPKDVKILQRYWKKVLMTPKTSLRRALTDKQLLGPRLRGRPGTLGV